VTKLRRAQTKPDRITAASSARGMI